MTLHPARIINPFSDEAVVRRITVAKVHVPVGVSFYHPDQFTFDIKLKSPVALNPVAFDQTNRFRITPVLLSQILCPVGAHIL